MLQVDLLIVLQVEGGGKEWYGEVEAVMVNGRREVNGKGRQLERILRGGKEDVGKAGRERWMGERSRDPVFEDRGDGEGNSWTEMRKWRKEDGEKEDDEGVDQSRKVG